MKFVLIGGTGSIGKEIANLLNKKGYSYANISRNIEKSRKILPAAVEHSTFLPKDEQQLLKIFEEADVIINLAGTSIAGQKWTDSYKKEIYDSRITTTAKIIELLNSVEKKDKVLISTSAIGIYGNRGDEILTEDSAASDDFLANLCRDWEAAAMSAPKNIRVVIPRISVVLDKNSGALAKMLTPFKFCIGGPLGSGRQWFSWIHISDLAHLFLEMAENANYKGIYNAVSPNPVRMKDFAQTLGKILRRPSLIPVPAFVLKILMGESASMVIFSQRVSAQKLQKNDFKYQFSTLESALRNFKF